MTDTTQNTVVQSVNDTVRSVDDWAQKQSEMLQHAKTRPAMYVGDQKTAHRNIIRTSMRLLWQAKVFQQPRRGRVDLSPTQCVIRCDAGPLIRPVQQMFSFPGGHVMGESWQQESHDYFQRLQAEEEAKGLEWSQQRHRRGWRYCFTGLTGPRLAEPSYPALLATRLIWGLRTKDGLWCQAYKEGWPSSAPFLLDVPSSVGLIVLADLNPLWFTGLPFNAEDMERLRSASNKPMGLDQKYKPQPAWSTGEIEALWHEANDLVTEKSLTAEGVREWLYGPDLRSYELPPGDG